MTQAKKLAATHGPFAYENWIAFQSNEALQATMEYPLFSDTHIIGNDLESGPYHLINSVNINVHQHRPAIILRVDNYLDFQLSQHEKTDDSRYHGGLLSDEVAALVSLCLGIRLKSGGANRVFKLNDDPKGRPISWGLDEDPIIPQVKGPRVLPRVISEHNLAQAAILRTLHLVSPKNAMALVHAARLYQEAVWIAESTPELSWIMLTSAIETAAGQWQSEKETPRDRLRALHPELEKLLAVHGEQHVTDVANLIADLLKVRKKFTDFVLNFLPTPPQARPATRYQLSWNSEAMIESMDFIYWYRSKALHAGVPFPAPMCSPPFIVESGGEPSETPRGLATITRGGVWRREHCPMLLHTFEYIVRGAILNWWSSIVPQSTQIVE